MKILLVSHGYPPRGRFGTEFYTREIARGLVQRGHEVDVFHSDRGLAAPPGTLVEATEEGVRVARVAPAPYRRTSFEASYRSPEVEQAFEAWLARRPAELVHFTYLLGGLSLALPGLARRRGIRCAVTLTDYGLLCHRGQMFNARLARCGGPHPAATCARCIRTASRYDAPPLSRALKNGAAGVLAALGGLLGVPDRAALERREALVRELFDAVGLFLAPTRHLAQVFAAAGIDAHRIEHLVYAFNEAPYTAARRAPDAPATFGFAGQFAPHKGLATLVEAARRLDAREPGRPWKVVLWGERPGGRHARYAPEVLSRAHPGRVEVRTPFDAAEAPAVLSGLAALVLPSEWDENAPLSVLQARGLGIPVLASDVPGIAEVLAPRAGALVPVGDADVLAARMGDVLAGRIGRDPEPGLPLAFEAHLDALERRYAELRPATDARRAGGAGLELGILAQGWFPDAGGIESHTRDLARELRSLGHRVRALVLDYGDREPFTSRVEEVEGVEVERIAYRHHDQRALADLVDHPRLAAHAVAWARRTGLDLVHVHHVTGFGCGVLPALRGAGVPLVMTLHDYWPLCPRGQMVQPDGTVDATVEPERCGACLARTWPRLMPSAHGERRGPRGAPVRDDADAARARTEFALAALAAPARLFTPSEAAKAVYVRAGVPAERIVVAPNGIEVSGLAAEVERLRAVRTRPAGELRLGILGSVLPSKGALELARAFQEARVPGLVLEIHGALPPYHGDTRYVDALHALAAGDPRVRLHGPYHHDELARILAGLDGVAAPSRWCEVFGLTVREARAAGLPVLVSSAGDLASVAAGGAAGIVVDPDDRAGWVRALAAFADPGNRARWRAWRTPPHSARDMARALERAYREVVGPQRGRWT